MAQNLGVHAGTGFPIGDSGFVPSALNMVGVAAGKATRIFDDLIELTGDLDKDYILGYEPQANKKTWYVLTDLIEKAKPYQSHLYIKTWKGSGATSASVTLVDQAGSPQNTLKLQAAYRNHQAYGSYDNNINVKITNVVRQSTTINAISAVSGGISSDIVVKSVVGIVVGDELKLTHLSTAKYFTVTAINETTNTLTGIPESSVTYSVDDTVEVMNFQIVTYIKDYRGAIIKLPLALNDAYLSMNSAATDYYVVNVLQNHELFTGINQSSSTLGYKSFPVDSTDYQPFTGGADGTAISSIADYTSLQSAFDNIRLVWLMTTDTTLTGVHSNYRAYCNSRRDTDFPLYVGELPNYSNDYTSLANYCRDFLTRVDWNRIGLFYGQRYVVDPIGSVLKLSVYGGVIGKWINMIYSGQAHHAVSEYAYTFDYQKGQQPIYEDSWNDEIRTLLYDAGCNIMQNVQGFGIILRNFRSPSNDNRTRDLHRFIIDQLIKFSAEDNLRTSENRPAKYFELNKAKSIIETKLLQPLYDGSFFPFVVKQTGDGGAFADVLADGSQATSWKDVSRCDVSKFVNPIDQLAQGIGRMYIDWASYSLLNRFYITSRVGITL